MVKLRPLCCWPPSLLQVFPGTVSSYEGCSTFIIQQEPLRYILSSCNPPWSKCPIMCQMSGLHIVNKNLMKLDRDQWPETKLINRVDDFNHKESPAKLVWLFVKRIPYRCTITVYRYIQGQHQGKILYTAIQRDTGPLPLPHTIIYNVSVLYSHP